MLALGNFGFFVRELHKTLLPTDMKYLNVIFKEAIVPNSAKSLKPSNRITASPSSFSFLFIPPLFLHPFCSIPPVSGEPFHTFLLSPFHMEEQLLRVHSVSLPSSPTPPLLATTLRSRGNHTVWTKCATNLSDDVCFPPPFPCLFFFSFLFLPVCFNAVYMFDKVLWDALPSHVNRLKFCSVINETKIYRVVVCVCMCGGEWGLGGWGLVPSLVW